MTKTEMLHRYRHLLQELHASNEFSKEQLWRWLEEAEMVMARDTVPYTYVGQSSD